jgi:hypothetical protein
MSSETKFRLSLILLLTALFGLVAKNVLAEEVTISVLPKVAITNPYTVTTFRIFWQIPQHKDNRMYSISYSCGSDIHSSQRDLEGDKAAVSYTRYTDLRVVSNCLFLVCVHRLEEGSVRNFCAHQEITTPDP